MQNKVNKYLPYRKYELPEGLPILQKNLRQDSIFLKKIEKECSTLRSLKNK
jgi:hypothetical protein